MTEAELIARYPRLYHMAQDGAWPSIRDHGLLSVSALLDLYDVDDATRTSIAATRRPASVTLTREELPGAVVRDQLPMSDAALARILDDDLTPADWYRLLNSRVFFWLSQARLERLLGARAYRGQAQCVLTLDTASLVSAHRDNIRLCPINSGATIFSGPRRGLATFTTIDDYPFATWRTKRGNADAIVELSVLRGVPDIADHVVAVHRVLDGQRTHMPMP